MNPFDNDIEEVEVSKISNLKEKGTSIYKEKIDKTLPADVIIFEGNIPLKEDVRATRGYSIACMMMVKNEKKRIHISLESVVNSVDAFVIYDTGSTDETIDIIHKFCLKHNKALYLIQGKFVNFSISRNVLLNYGDSIPLIDFFLLFDCNDELKTPKELHQLCKTTYKTENILGYYITQEWLSGDITKYRNIRLIKSRSGWRYKGAIHEFISIDELDEMKKKPELMMHGYESTILNGCNVVIYQDRTQDDDKTSKRFTKDKEILKKSYMSENPHEPRTVFYYAQTLGCLGEWDESYDRYIERSKMGDFWEEVFHSHLRMGEIALNHYKNIPRATFHFLDSIKIQVRAEPLCYLARLYLAQDNVNSAEIFIDRAMLLSYPEECFLFCDRKTYDFTRYMWFADVCSAKNPEPWNPNYIKKLKDAEDMLKSKLSSASDEERKKCDEILTKLRQKIHTTETTRIEAGLPASTDLKDVLKHKMNQAKNKRKGK